MTSTDRSEMANEGSVAATADFISQDYRPDRFDVWVRRSHDGGHYIWSPWLLDCGWGTAYTTEAWLRSQGETCKIELRPWWGGLNPETTETEETQWNVEK